MQYFYLWVFAFTVLESFPISSSGHIALLEKICPAWHTYIPFVCSEMVGLTDIKNIKIVFSEFLHIIPAIVIVLFFFKQWFNFLFVNKYKKILFHIIINVVVADLITALFYFLNIKKLGLPLAIGFLLSGLALLSLLWCQRGTRKEWTLTDAITVGIVQGITLIPGISRFALTYVISRWQGLYWKNALGISFLIELPLILAAFVRSLIILQQADMLSCIITIPLLMIFIISILCGLLGLYGVYKLMEYNKLWLFSFYFIIPIIVSLL